MRSPWLTAARRTVRLVAWIALPGQFRSAVGRELHEAFLDQSRARLAQDGLTGLARLVASTSWDLIRVGAQERRRPSVGQANGMDTNGREGMTMRMDGFFHDLKHAARALRRDRGFTAVSVLMLTVGIGGTTGIYTLVHKLLLAPMPGLTAPHELVAVGITAPGSSFRTFPYPVYAELRDRVDAFEGVIAHSRIGLTLRGEGPAERVTSEIVSGNYFSVLGASLAAGRGFTADETIEGGPLVAVLSHAAWVDRFGADPDLVGRTVSLNGEPFTVVGVATSDFLGLRIDGPAPEFWVPLSTHAASIPTNEFNPLTSMGDFWLFVAARTADGVTVPQATAAVDSFVEGFKESLPETYADFGMVITPDIAVPHPGNRREITTILVMLLAVVGLLLAIVCSNVASLFLSRAATRRREIGIRLSLGSSRGRVIRQLLVESSLVGALGGMLGLLVAAPVSDLILRLYGERFTIPMQPDLRVALFAIVLAIGTGLLFGLAPAIFASRGDLARTLGQSRTGAMTGTPRLRSALAVAQVSLSAVLLVGAALFVRSLSNIASIDPGFDVRGLVTARVDLSLLDLSEDEGRALYRTMLERVEAIPGVRSATLSLNAPFAGGGRGGAFRIVGRPVIEGDERLDAPYNVLWPGYFETMGTPLLRGRDFSLADDLAAQQVAIVTESFGERFWPGEEVLGQRIERGSNQIEIIGVVADSKFGTISEETQTFFFRSLLQRYETRAEVIVRAEGSPVSLIPALRAELQAIDDDLPPVRVATLESMADDGLARHRLAATVTGAFTLLAMLLAALGLYGLLSYGVTQRRQEIGIRMALGARKEEVTAMVTRRGLGLGIVGLGLGLVVAGAFARFAGSLLYGVSPFDPVSFGAAAVVLTAVASVACWLPARRASRVDPAEALRLE